MLFCKRCITATSIAIMYVFNKINSMRKDYSSVYLRDFLSFTPFGNKKLIVTQALLGSEDNIRCNVPWSINLRKYNKIWAGVFVTNIVLDHKSYATGYKFIKALTDWTWLLLMLFTCKRAPMCHCRPKVEECESRNTSARILHWALHLSSGSRSLCWFGLETKQYNILKPN